MIASIYFVSIEVKPNDVFINNYSAHSGGLAHRFISSRMNGVMLVESHAMVVYLDGACTCNYSFGCPEQYDDVSSK